VGAASANPPETQRHAVADELLDQLSSVRKPAVFTGTETMRADHDNTQRIAAISDPILAFIKLTLRTEAPEIRKLVAERLIHVCSASLVVAPDKGTLPYSVEQASEQYSRYKSSSARTSIPEPVAMAISQLRCSQCSSDCRFLETLWQTLLEWYSINPGYRPRVEDIAGKMHYCRETVSRKIKRHGAVSWNALLSGLSPRSR
jgi:hypothetical protein